MVLGGDFKQLLPIKINRTRNESLNLSIKNSILWNNFTWFCRIFDVGDGVLNDQNDCKELPERCVMPENGHIVQETFGELINQKKYDEMSQCTILSARNLDVDEINEQVTNSLDPNT